MKAFRAWVARNRTSIGVTVTVGWLLVWVPGTFLSCEVLDVCERALTSNEWGDWAAGTFAPIAFLWLVLGYLQQGEELKQNTAALHQQEQALKAQVAELAASVQAQSSLAKATQQQVIEAAFFQLLARFTEVARDVRYGTDDRGRGAMRRFFSAFSDRANNALAANRRGDYEVVRDPREIIRSEFDRFIAENGAELHHYFRTLFHVFKFIIEHDGLAEPDKVRYANVARAQLSTYELSMLFYNGTTGQGLGFLGYIEQYGLLKHVSELIESRDKGGGYFYHAHAFMDADARRASPRGN